MQRIESRSNSTLKHMVRLGRERKYRRSCGEMLCEGERMLAEALSSGICITGILLREGASGSLAVNAQEAERRGVRVLEAPAQIFEAASAVETSQGVVFSCKTPVFDAQGVKDAARIVLLDGLQDPGNMGTILRTADAFAIDAVILLEGCTDYTAPKVVRATMGALFRLPVIELPLAQAAELVQVCELPLYAAALAPDSVPVHQTALSRSAVIIGNEGAGVSQEALRLADEKIILPMKGTAESLNASVAAAILMWEMSK